MISTIGCPAATVNVYDSLHGTLPSRAQRVVADILQCQSTYITVRYPDVQWQSNSHDCGLFTLANATALCAGVDPCTLSFEHARMRDHYLNCIKAGILLPFPLRSKRRRINTPQLQSVPIFFAFAASQTMEHRWCNATSARTGSTRSVSEYQRPVCRRKIRRGPVPHAGRHLGRDSPTYVRMTTVWILDMLTMFFLKFTLILMLKLQFR